MTAQAMRDWKTSVLLAKYKLGIPDKSFVMIKGSLLKEAQRGYCAMVTVRSMYHKKKNNIGYNIYKK